MSRQFFSISRSRRSARTCLEMSFTTIPSWRPALVCQLASETWMSTRRPLRASPWVTKRALSGASWLPTRRISALKASRWPSVTSSSNGRPRISSEGYPNRSSAPGLQSMISLFEPATTMPWLTMRRENSRLRASRSSSSSREPGRASARGALRWAKPIRIPNTKGTESRSQSRGSREWTAQRLGGSAPKAPEVSCSHVPSAGRIAPTAAPTATLDQGLTGAR
jgi:hypothetical protein